MSVLLLRSAVAAWVGAAGVATAVLAPPVRAEALTTTGSAITSPVATASLPGPQPPAAVGASEEVVVDVPAATFTAEDGLPGQLSAGASYRLRIGLWVSAQAAPARVTATVAGVWHHERCHTDVGAGVSWVGCALSVPADAVGRLTVRVGVDTSGAGRFTRTYVHAVVAATG